MLYEKTNGIFEIKSKSFKTVFHKPSLKIGLQRWFLKAIFNFIDKIL